MDDLVHINGVPIQNITMGEALPLIAEWVDRKEQRSIFFVNADCMNISARNAEYHAALTTPDVAIFGDGVGIRLASQLSQQPIRDNVNGTDMFPLLCRQCALNGQTIFLLGAQQGVAERARQRMMSRFPGLNVVGTHHGFFDPNNCDDVIEAINASGADILLVGFGAPRQELFIARHRDRLTPSVAMGVGGLFDFYSGRIKRAPEVFRNNGLEWTWRLAMEPRRMWRRYLVGNFTFMGRVMWWQMTGRNPALGLLSILLTLAAFLLLIPAVVFVVECFAALLPERRPKLGPRRAPTAHRNSRPRSQRRSGTQRHLGVSQSRVHGRRFESWWSLTTARTAPLKSPSKAGPSASSVKTTSEEAKATPWCTASTTCRRLRPRS